MLLGRVWGPIGLGMAVSRALSMCMIEAIGGVEDLLVRLGLQTVQVAVKDGVVIVQAAQIEPGLGGQGMVGKMRLAMVEVLRCLGLERAVRGGHLLMEESIRLHCRGRGRGRGRGLSALGSTASCLGLVRVIDDAAFASQLGTFARSSTVGVLIPCTLEMA